jgi:hypothetical protein
MKKSILIAVAMIIVNSSIAQNKINQDSLDKEAAKTEIWEPVPAMVIPGKTNNEAPSDALLLFDGKDLSKWETKKGDVPGWKIEKDGVLTIVKGSGDIRTKQAFGDCQLHLEWREPAAIAQSGQYRANGGIYFMGRYELQILDSYNNPTYVNGQAGSMYKQHIPLVNACKKPGEWQTFDVIFTAPRFYADGKIQTPGRVTVTQNGVLIQNNVEIKGATAWIGKPQYYSHASKEPLLLQEHGFDGGNPLSFRNIWIREL